MQRSGVAGARWIHGALAVLVVAAFAVNFARHHLMIDDGYIAFRYSRNLVEGHGLVFNVGERVEGYTQFLWVMLVAGGMAAGLQPETVAAVLGFASGLGILALLVLMSRRWYGGASPWIWLAPLALALNRSFCAWSSGGLGTQLFAFFVLASGYAFTIERESRARWPWRSSLLCALAILSRPEGALFTTVIGLFFIWETLIRRRRRFASLLMWAGSCLAVVGVHLAWRVAYYGEWLPNTFYAKVSGAWWEQGRIYLTHFLRSHVPFLFPFFCLVLVLRRREAGPWLFAVQSAAYVGYIGYVGGDHFEFRFMTPVLPLMFWLWADCARWIVDRVPAGTVARAAAVLMWGLILASSSAPDRRTFGLHRGIAALENLEDYVEFRSREGKLLRRLVEEGYLPEDTLVAVRGAGALPYFAELPILDVHGLMDPRIARMPLKERGLVGHEKFATPEYLRERRVVIVDVLNRIIENPDARKKTPKEVDRPYFVGPVRRVRALGTVLAFSTTLSDAEFRRVFSKFEILD